MIDHFLRFLAAVEAVAKGVCGDELVIRWMDSGVPHALPDRQIALIRPRKLDRQHELLVLSDSVHECAHVQFTDWDVMEHLRSMADYEYQHLHSIWNGFEDVFIEHKSMANEPGTAWLFRSSCRIAKALGAIKTLDNQADWLPMAVIFHDFSVLRGWNEWNDDYIRALDLLRAETSEQQVDALITLLNEGVPSSSRQAVIKARKVYDLFRDFIDSLDQPPSNGEGVDYGKAVEADRDRLEKGEPPVGEGDPSQEGEPSDGDEDSDDADKPSKEGESSKGDEGNDPIISDSADPADGMTGGKADGFFYPPIKGLSRPKSPMGEECRNALERFPQPRRQRRRSNKGRLNPGKAWAISTGDDRVFSRKKKVVDSQLPALGLLLDLSGSMKNQVFGMLQASSGVLTAYGRSRQPLGVFGFGLKNDAFGVVKSFSDSVDLGQARLASIDDIVGGGSPMGAGLTQVLSDLDKVPHKSKRILIVSDGDVDGMSEFQIQGYRTRYPDITFEVVSLNGRIEPMESVITHALQNATELPDVLRTL